MIPGTGRGLADWTPQGRGRLMAPRERAVPAPSGAVRAGQGPSGLAPGPASDPVPAVAVWTLTVTRVVLGLVLAWSGYHELVFPTRWTGSVPVISATSQLAEVLVLAHGWLLLVLAVALVAGVAPRLAAAAASLLLVEVVVSRIASGGLSAPVLLDIGILGLAVAVAGAQGQRLLLRR